MSEKQSKSYLLEELWRSSIDGNPVMPENAGNESTNYYLAQIVAMLKQYGGIKGIAHVDGLTLPNPIPTPIMLGTLSDHTEFEADGTMQAVGDATCWRDELQMLVGSRLESPSSDIQLNIPEGSVTFETSARYATDYVVMSIQINHDWLVGSAVHPHLHWWQVSSDVPNWMIGYRWQRQGQAKTTSWTNQIYTTHGYTYTSGTLNQITEFGTITPPADYSPVSDILQVRIYRDVTNASTLFAGADPESSDVDAVNFDIHFQVDTLGSREEYSK
jgi:hypothetical protein